MIKTIDLKGEKIEYQLERKKVKNINVRIRRDGSVYVSASRWVTVKEIESFLSEKADFILSAVHKNSENIKEDKITLNGGDKIYIFGDLVPLLVTKGNKNSVKLTENELILTVTDTEDFELKSKVLSSWRKEFALKILTEFCMEVYPIFEKQGISFPQIKVRDMVSRWGSCHTVKGILTFNTKLIHAPKECIYYVVVHEFMHFIHPDHSPRFHNAMSQVMPEWKVLRKRLNEQKIR